MTRVAKALIYDGQGRLLVIRRSATHPRFAHEADLPGGMIERGETYTEGLVREIREETGLHVDESDLSYVARTRRYGLNEWYLYETTVTAAPTVILSWEHDRYEWLDPVSAELVGHDSFMDFASMYANRTSRPNARANEP